MMPAGSPWRTGADAATTLITDKPLKFGSLSVPAGRLHHQHRDRARTWQLILGRLGGPAAEYGVPYKPELEIGRARMSARARRRRRSSR